MEKSKGKNATNELNAKGQKSTKYSRDSTSNFLAKTFSSKNSKPSNLLKHGTDESKLTVSSSEKILNPTIDIALPKLKSFSSSISLGEDSDSGLSDSSDRIIAWLADTSKIDFKDHPVPTIQANVCPANSSVKSSDCSKTEAKQKPEAVTCARVPSTTLDTSKCETSTKDMLLRGHTSVCAKLAMYPTILLQVNTLPVNQKMQQKTRKIMYQLNNNSVKIIQSDSSRVALANQDTTTLIPKRNISKSGNAVPREKSDSAAKSLISTENPKRYHGNTWRRSQEHSLQNDVDFSQGNVASSSQSSAVKHGLNDVTSVRDDVISMDECVSSDVSIPLSTSDVVDMDIDNAENFAKEIVQELKEMRNNMVVRPSKIQNNDMDLCYSNGSFEGSLYIVLDTNVLLSHLKFVVELKDYPIPGIGMPILVIPWIVIQELDSLKENRWKCHESGDKSNRVDFLARISIKFLNCCFQKEDPRVRGQTIKEAAEPVGTLAEETNDDKILQCCLLFKERAKNGCCVLFSNDVNLCNKAIMNGIKAFNYEKLLPGLKNLFQCTVIVKQHNEEYNAQLVIEEDKARQRQKADDILCELQIILREGLSYIIESEMRKAYDDLWEEITFIKPPWTLIDVLQLLDKHWIAVFGHILKRDKKKIIEELRQKFDDRKGTASSLQFCSEMLKLALELFQCFSYHSNYDEAIPKCLAAVTVLVKKCQQYEANMSGNSGDQAKCLTYSTLSNNITDDAYRGSSNTTNNEELCGASTKSTHDDVVNTFNLIWSAVTQFSTQIFNALGFPNTITEGIRENYPEASKEEAVSFLYVLCPKLINLVECIQNILRDPWEKISLNKNLFTQLEQAISIFLKEILSRDNNSTAEKIYAFCEDVSMRKSLVQGLAQLDQASTMLQNCVTFIS
ncbi:transcriptional protein SWT1-like [Xenia sp. Carnegie-2017]|uniref:transcriptional protein SWT1-like n=1 Tax=Xenia sp. Carnegie-2017 TaxID=2897299 RepID=UPI001F03426A|nr:transcriptional protein SWT1-like [Xenia sp. Carnegie-2017]XP_046845453.1 transcriptional protein SWT1-like [Xenia sp. Carnegie-2017]